MAPKYDPDDIKMLIQEKYKSITLFAEKVGLSQPSVSYSIQAQQPKFMKTLEKAGIDVSVLKPHTNTVAENHIIFHNETIAKDMLELKTKEISLLNREIELLKRYAVDNEHLTIINKKLIDDIQKLEFQLNDLTNELEKCLKQKK